MKTRTNLAAVAVIALLALSACASSTSTSGLEEFESSLEGGASCEELFELRNELDPSSHTVVEANEALQEIGCYSSSSTRTDL
ncbi:hypothetical protein [Brachybacterium sp.]|jgi:hypothetical protein|uniref:hypothetical protein n=1 Tax=Brachybacterium sp. TaxID=1891286 RepID=UPI002ED07287